MALALERMIAPVTGAPARTFTHDAESRLEISVVFTSLEGTLAALKEAGNIASVLGGRITLVVPQVVPYPLPLASPPALVEFSERRLRVIAAGCRVETRVTVYLCRDALATLKSVLKPQSMVVVGNRRRWWPTREKRLAAKLRRAGYEVVTAERAAERK